MYDVDENGMIDLNEMTRLVKSIFKVSQSKVIGSLPPSLPPFLYIYYTTLERNLCKLIMKRKLSPKFLSKLS